MRVRLLAIAVVAVVAATLSLASPAYADVIHVGPGGSIQAAVDAAHPGDTIIVSRGVYQESVTITTDDLTLIGSGNGEQGSVVEMPANPPTSPCAQPGDVSGFCIFGDFNSGTPVDNVTVKGFRIEGFSDTGVLGILVTNHHIESNLAADNGGYGIACFECSGGTYLDNTAFRNVEAGFYQGDSPDVSSLMQGNESTLNGFGFFMRDSRGGTLADNVARGNCIGLLFLDTGAPTAMGDWTAYDNNVFRNDHECPASEEGPALSGIGIGIAGGDSLDIHDNTVWSNAPGGPSAVRGGIFEGTGAPFGGAPPTNNAVDQNIAYGNHPLDIVYDGSGSGNTFAANQCGKSKPRTICAT